jgi:hypothetical protein
MCARLSRGQPNGIEHSTLLVEGQTRKVLVSDLSEVGKERQGKKHIDVVGLWTRLIDHLFSVLTLAK